MASATCASGMAPYTGSVRLARSGRSLLTLIDASTSMRSSGGMVAGADSAARGGATCTGTGAGGASITGAAHDTSAHSKKPRGARRIAHDDSASGRRRLRATLAEDVQDLDRHAHEQRAQEQSPCSEHRD